MPSLAGPKRPQDRIELAGRQEELPGDARRPPRETGISIDGAPASLRDGAVVIAAITSCTNTSNPSVMLAAGLLAKKAVERGLRAKPWVKTTLAPGSKVVCDYLRSRRPDERPGSAEVPPGGLRLHHLHRKQRAAARTGGRGRAERKAGGSCRAQRQSQLRRPHELAGEGQLPGLAAAGGGLRHRRTHGHRSGHRTARQRSRGRARLSARHLAHQRGDPESR